MSIFTVRSRRASMNSLFCRRRYSGSLVCPRITSSMSVWANFFGLILCSWLAPSRSYRNATSSFSTSMNSTSPRLAMFSSPSKLNARGSEAEPYSPISLQLLSPLTALRSAGVRVERLAARWVFGGGAVGVLPGKVVRRAGGVTVLTPPPRVERGGDAPLAPPHRPGPRVPPPFGAVPQGGALERVHQL